MTTQDLLHQRIDELTPSLHAEVLAFIEFLQFKQQGQSNDTPIKPQNSESLVCKNGHSEQNQDIIKILQEISQRGTAFNDVDDPVTWQKEIRLDKPLIGR